MDDELQRLRAQRLAHLQAQQQSTDPHGAIEATDTDFDAVTAHGTVFVDMWAAWCGPCKVFGPIFERVARATGDKARFVKVDVDHNRQTAMKYGIQSIPTLLVFQEGKLVHRQAGALPEAMFAKLVSHFAK